MLAHMILRGLVYGMIFKLLRHLTLPETVALVEVVVAVVVCREIQKIAISMGVKRGVKMGYEKIDRDQRFDEHGDDVAVMRIAVHSNHSKRSNPATQNSRKTTADCGPLAPPLGSTIPQR
jgi:hypothetical protein